MVETTDPGQIRSRCKAITALFPYAVRREQDRQPVMLEVFLRLARASGQWGFMWHRVRLLVATLLKEEGSVSLKRAVLHALPHIPWANSTNGQHLVQLWATAASVFPYTDEIGQSVVDTLLHIASEDSLRPHIPVGMWPWLSNQPPFPLVCWGRFQGTQREVIQTIRALGNIEILKSYMLLVWSERDYLGFLGLHELCTSIQEDFSGIGMGRHREDLLQHLGHILSQLDLGLEHLRRDEPGLSGGDIEYMKYEYGELKGALLEADREAVLFLARELSSWSSFSIGLLTRAYHREPFGFYVCDSSPVFVVVNLEHSSFIPSTTPPVDRPRFIPQPSVDSSYNPFPVFSPSSSYRVVLRLPQVSRLSTQVCPYTIPPPPHHTPPTL